MATAGVAGGCSRGRIAGSAGEADTGMPPVVPNESLDRTPSGRGFADDRSDDEAVGLGGGSTGGAVGARRVSGNPCRGSSGDWNGAEGALGSDGSSIVVVFGTKS